MKLLFAVLVVLLNASLNVGLVRSQESGCSIDLTHAIALLEDAQAIFDNGDSEAALRLVSQAESLLQLVAEKCETWAPAAAGESRANPVPFGQRQLIDEGKASIEITQYIPEANSIVMDAASSNDKPAEDQRYILVELTYHCELDPVESCEYHGVTNFRLIGSRGVVYEDFPIGFPIEVEVFGGGQITVQRAWLVGIEEDEFQLFFDPIGGNRVFFSLK